MPKGIPLTEEEQNKRRHEVFAASVHLFIEKGFQETTMKEISDAAGMGKSTLYDYFKTKDEILLWGMEDGIYDLTEIAKQITSRDLPAAEKLHEVMHSHLQFLLENWEFYTKLTFEVQRLGIESQQRIQSQNNAYQDMLRGLVEDAIREGAFRPVNSLFAARIILSLLTPAVFTSHPTGTSEQTMDEAIEIFYRGVQA